MHNLQNLLDLLLHKVHYAQPQYFLLLLAIVPLLWAAKFRRTSFGHSQVGLHKNIRSISFLGWIPITLLIALIVGLSLTGAQPEQTHIINPHVLARDYVVQVDISSSMSEALSDPAMKDFANKSNPEANKKNLPPDIAAYLQQLGVDDGEGGEGDSGPKGPTKAMAAREGVKEFLDHRIKGTDRVGLMVFDTRVYLSEPLGLNLRPVYNRLDDILHSGGGTNFDGPSGTSTDKGAIQGAIDHFKQLSTSNTKVLIMVTDGEDSMSAERVEELTRQLMQLHIKMYVIGVGDGWAKPDHTCDLKKFTEADPLNGLVLVAGNAQQLRDGFAKIDSIEASDTKMGGTEVKEQYYPYCAAASALFLLLWLLAAFLVGETV